MFRQFARLLLLFLEAVASLNCMPMMNLQTHLKDFRVDRSLFAMLGIHVLTMTISVEIQYHVPVFTLLIGTVYGPVLAATIVLVSIIITSELNIPTMTFTHRFPLSAAARIRTSGNQEVLSSTTQRFALLTSS